MAGVLALHGLGVRSADALSGDGGLALEHLHVIPPRDEPIDWDRVVNDLERALDGRLAIRARLADRVRTYARPSRSPWDSPPTVHIDNDASAKATVVEVHARDAIGLLYRVTRALVELDVDIRSAKVQTLGETVVDAFYVRGADGDKITDRGHLAEIERPILARLSAPL